MAGLSGSSAAGVQLGNRMTLSADVSALPALLALDAHTVLAGKRRAASVQLDEAYFQGQLAALDAVEMTDGLERRRAIVAESHERFAGLTIDFDDLSRTTLESASVDFHRVLTKLPEVQYLRTKAPGQLLVVPEWLRSQGQVGYGARLYLIREDDTLEPQDIVQKNIDAVLSREDAPFERYLGELYGYPECCLEYFSEQDRSTGPPPEVTSTAVLAEYIDTETLSPESEDPRSIRDAVDGLFESPDVYAFFTREFFPEPGCHTARRLGTTIFDLLTEAYPTALVKDFFRINATWSYLMAQRLRSSGDGNRRPPAGSLGREHRQFHLPLSILSQLPAYRRD